MFSYTAVCLLLQACWYTCSCLSIASSMLVHSCAFIVSNIQTHSCLFIVLGIMQLGVCFSNFLTHCCLFVCLFVHSIPTQCCKRSRCRLKFRMSLTCLSPQSSHALCRLLSVLAEMKRSFPVLYVNPSEEAYTMMLAFQSFNQSICPAVKLLPRAPLRCFRPMYSLCILGQNLLIIL